MLISIIVFLSALLACILYFLLTLIASYNIASPHLLGITLNTKDNQTSCLQVLETLIHLLQLIGKEVSSRELTRSDSSSRHTNFSGAAVVSHT